MTSLTSIEVEAFRNFVGKTALDLSDFPAGLHLVRGVNLTNDRLGSNGSGKSTFFSDAATWCLYGRTVGGLRTTEVQSWLTEDPPRVAVDVRREDKDHVVARGPKASALTVDGKAVGQEEVDALVGLDYAAWCQAVIWGQGMPLFFDLAPAAKMALLSDALGLERWERRAQAAGARAKRLEDRLRGLEGEIRGLEAAREHAQDALGAARDAANEWGAAQAALIEKNALAGRAASARAASVEAKRGDASLASDSAGTAAKMLRPVVEDARAKMTEHRNTARIRRAAAGMIADELARVQDQLKSFTKGGTCPTCGQAVTKSASAKHADELRARAAELRRGEESAEQDTDREEALADKIRDSLAENETRMHELEEAERRAEGDLRLLDRALGAAQAEAASAWEAHRRAEAEVNPHREAAQVARARLREVEREIREKGELAGKLSESVERAQFWARGFRDIRLGIIDDVLDDLRGTTAEVLDGLGLGEWGVEYATERETKSGTTQRALTVAVRSPAAPEGVRWETYSGGERQRLRLAGALALSEVLLAHAGAALDFRVLDEPTRGLSAEGVRDLVEVLGNYAEQAGLKVFFIDHQAIDGAGFASTITVTNGEDGARVGA